MEVSGANAALFGVFLHLVLFRTSFPVEDHLYSLLALYTAVCITIGGALFSVANLSLFSAVCRVGWISCAFNIGLASSILGYRLFFHRLHRFPGPFLAKASRFYDTYLAWRKVQYNVEIENLHSQYGDFIRTGPREICVVRASAIPLILGPQSKNLKSTWYAQTNTNHKKCSIHQTRDFDDHRRRRKAWDRGFSIKALGVYEPRIKSRVDQLTSYIENNLGYPIDATAWSMFLSFDVMGDIGFGKDFNNLTTGIEHPAIKGIHDHMTVLGIMGHIPWLLNIIGRIPGAASGFSGFFTWCGEEVDRKKKGWESDKYPDDLISWLLKAYVENDSSASPSETALHEDSRVLIVAGSDTTATTLASILYYLAKYPAVQKKLQQRLDDAMPGGHQDWSFEKVKTVTFLDDIINETMRLRPALMTGGYRVTPAQGLQIDEVYIPGDVNVFVPIQLIQTDERYYKNPKQFIPERWSEEKGLVSKGAPFIPFSFGPYSCPGKNLALLMLRMTVSILVQEYDIAFAPGETGEAFEKGTLDTFTTTLPPVQVQFQKRTQVPRGE
ncbi:cytochrome P450 [Aspergillus avenaceus]|uniref:Cytochrome P450 n=1 Tax=Aspergillus avenaceus TaxID=36643 RepID=A0A5N6U771_ASPAV|nr:cytochrome P450 [Aspergillus avenaceus]